MRTHFVSNETAGCLRDQRLTAGLISNATKRLPVRLWRECERMSLPLSTCWQGGLDAVPVGGEVRSGWLGKEVEADRPGKGRCLPHLG